MQVMKEHEAQEIPGVIHCYSYSKELAGEFVKMGYFIGVGGVVTFKNARKLVETVEAIPMEHILELLAELAPRATWTLETRTAAESCRWLAERHWIGEVI